MSAPVALRDMRLECAAFYLNAEDGGSFDDQGGNVCACEGTETECKVESAGIQAPGPLDGP